MLYLEIMILGFALSLDAMSVAIGLSLCGPSLTRKDEARLGLYFGLFQAGMPILGFFMGQGFRSYVYAFDHWIAFGLLLYISINMLIEAMKSRHAVCTPADREALSRGRLILLSVATSIDALAAGISLAMTADYPIIWAALSIGCITFTLTWIGAHFGSRLGQHSQFSAQILGSLVLFGIAMKTLLTHLIQHI